MKHNSDFKYDLKLGQIGERYLADILENQKIEVKTDLQANKTGNVFIEYESRNKPSGIAKTEAQFYTFILSNELIILIDTDSLKDICRGYLSTPKDIKGGDSNTSKGILLPVKELIRQ